MTPEQAIALANARKRMAEAGGKAAPLAQSNLTPAQEFSSEHPIIRTVGRAGRNAAVGLASLPDLGLLVPKTAALMGSMGAEKMGFPKTADALEQLGRTPTVASMVVGSIDRATGNRLQPINGMEKVFDAWAQILSSSVPFMKGPQALEAIAPKPPSSGTALKSVLDPETALNQLPSVQAQKTALLPLPKITDEGKQLATLAKKYDIPIGMDDVTDSKFYQTMISEGKSVPFSGSQKFADKQMNQFTKAVSKSIGADTDKITPEIISNQFDEVGGKIGSFLEGKQINVGNEFGGKITEFMDNNIDNYTEEGQKRLSQWLSKITNVVDRGGMADGSKLERIRKQANKVARESGNQELATIARNIENFIVDAAEGSKGFSAEDVANFRKAKYQYKNLIAIEPLASKDQLGGNISPAQLLNRVRQVYGRAFSKGEAGELGDLANIGQYIKETIPNSGTAQRTGVRNLLTGNLMGVVPTAAFGGPLAAIAQGAASVGGMAANRGLQARNFDQELMDIAMQGVKKSQPLLTNQGALAAIAGTNTAGQQMLPKPSPLLTYQGAR